MLMPLHCFKDWRPVLIVCRRKYFGNEVGLKCHFFFFFFLPPFLRGVPGTQAKLTLPSILACLSFFSLLNLGGHPHRYLFFHILFLLFFGMGMETPDMYPTCRSHPSPLMNNYFAATNIYYFFEKKARKFFHFLP